MAQNLRAALRSLSLNGKGEELSAARSAVSSFLTASANPKDRAKVGRKRRTDRREPVPGCTAVESSALGETRGELSAPAVAVLDEGNRSASSAITIEYDLVRDLLGAAYSAVPKGR